MTIVWMPCCDTQVMSRLAGSMPITIKANNWEETSEQIDDIFLGDAEIWCAGQSWFACRQCACHPHGPSWAPLLKPTWPRVPQPCHFEMVPAQCGGTSIKPGDMGTAERHLKVAVLNAAWTNLQVQAGAGPDHGLLTHAAVAAAGEDPATARRTHGGACTPTPRRKATSSWM